MGHDTQALFTWETRRTAVSAFHPHPKRDHVPRPTDEQRAQLRDSMLSRGLQDQPITVTSDLMILDGHTRWEIAREIGWGSLAYVVVEVPENVQVDYMIRTAVERRQLTDGVWRELVGKLRSEGWSSRRIAEATGKSKSTVFREVQVSQSGTPETVVGRDGKVYPGAMPQRFKVAYAQSEPGANDPRTLNVRVEQIEAEPRTLDVRVLTEEQAEAAEADWTVAESGRTVTMALITLRDGHRSLSGETAWIIEQSPEYRARIAAVLRSTAHDLTKLADTIDRPEPRVDQAVDELRG